MREKLLVAFAALVGSVGAFVTALPFFGWLRKKRRRRDLLRSFRHAVAHDQLRAKFRREKEAFGDGFLDGFVGSAGLLRFRLTRRFRPFQSVDEFRLVVADEGFDFRLDVDKDADHPVVRAYRDLRQRYPMGASKSEAS